VITSPKLNVKNINKVNFAHFWLITTERKGGKRTKTVGQEERKKGKRAQSTKVHACVTGLSSTNDV